MKAATLLLGDCIERVRELANDSIDAVVTDPPYGLSFMGKKWDYDVPSVEVWRECMRVLKPGGHLLAFAGSRTQHRMACAIEDAGFEVRDMIAWVYGSGFPKSLDVSKAIDKRGGASVAWFGPWFREWRKQNGVTQKEVAALFPSKTGGLTGCVANWELGFNMPTPEQFNLIRDTFGLPFDSIEEAEREVVGQHAGDMGGLGGERLGQAGGNITAPATDAARQWSGWGTALKPAMEPITVARKPLVGTVAENVLRHGTGAINVDACRVKHSDEADLAQSLAKNPGRVDSVTSGVYGSNRPQQSVSALGRRPANLIHDGSDEVVGLLGDAARFFKCAKANKADRDEGCEGLEERHVSTMNDYARPSERRTADKNGGPKRNHHPTVKPTALMRYLCRLVTPPGGLVLDPFMGSGSTGKAALLEGFRFIGIERDEGYMEIARARIGKVRET